MKILVLILIILGASDISAESISVQLLQNSRMADDDVFSVGSWTGVQVSYQPNNSGYVFISNERAEVSARGTAWMYNMTGVGVGNKIQLTDNIRIFGQIGYYKIDNSLGRKRGDNESLWYYLNRRYYGVHLVYGLGEQYVVFDEYEVKNDAAIGGTIGVEMSYPLSKNWSTDFVFSYRAMKIKETISGYVDAWVPERYWETGMNKNYSSINFGMSVNYSF